jgi:hypothetical protein
MSAAKTVLTLRSLTASSACLNRGVECGDTSVDVRLDHAGVKGVVVR